MELVVRKNDLLRELQFFQGIVERKSTIPILANVLLEAAGAEVKLLATDLEVSLRSRCDASVARGGALTLPAKKLFEIVKALRGWTSGLAVPHFVIDAPGGGGKVPLLPEYVEEITDDEVVFRNYEGKRFVYKQPKVAAAGCGPALEGEPQVVPLEARKPGRPARRTRRRSAAG